MKAIAWFYPVTAAVVFFQAISGASTVLDFYNFDMHMMTGYVTAVFALVAVIIPFVLKPKYNALRYSSLVLFILVVLQGFIGFAAEKSDQVVAIHFVNFLILYAVVISTIFYAFRWGRMVPPPTQQVVAAAKP